MFEHPELEERIPPNAKIVILPEYDPDLCEYNLRLSNNQKETGQSIVFVKVGSLAPKIYSRLKDARIELAA